MEILDQPIAVDQRQPATNGSRILAYLLDVLIAIGLYIVPLVGLVAGAVYMVTRDGLPFLNGQSIGKRAMGIKAVTVDGASLSNNWGPAIIRNVVLLIPAFPLVELIVLLSNPNQQRLGDQWARTKVVIDPTV